MKLKIIILVFGLLFFAQHSVFAQDTSRPQITIPQKKTIYINNQPFIPRGIWNPFVVSLGELANSDTIRQRIEELGSKRFNFLVEKINCLSAFTACKNVLDALSAYNQNKTSPNEQIWAFFSLQDVLYDKNLSEGNRIEKAKEVVRKVYSYPYFLGMLLGDEPDYGHAQPAFLTQVNQAFHQEFPSLLTFIDLAKSDPASVKSFLTSTDILAHEQHFYKTIYASYEDYLPKLVADVKQFVNATKNINGEYQVPVWGAVHTFGNYTGYTDSPPTPQQHSAIVKKWLEAGVTGVIYYAYQHTNWILPKESPPSWPNTSGDFGSPALWSSLTGTNAYVNTTIWSRDIGESPTVTLTPNPNSTITLSPTGSILCPRKVHGDANCDGEVDGLDYSLWLNTQCHKSSNQTCARVEADFTRDGNTDDEDYRVWFIHRNT